RDRHDGRRRHGFRRRPRTRRGIKKRRPLSEGRLPYLAETRLTVYEPPGFVMSEPLMTGMLTAPVPNDGPPANARPVKVVALIVIDENAKMSPENLAPPSVAELPTCQ